MTGIDIVMGFKAFWALKRFGLRNIETDPNHEWAEPRTGPHL